MKIETEVLTEEHNKLKVTIMPIKISEEERKKRRERILKALLEDNDV